jgi:hypothetical protein
MVTARKRFDQYRFSNARLAAHQNQATHTTAAFFQSGVQLG